MTEDYSDLAYDALAIVRLMQTGEDDQLGDDLNVLVGDRGEEGLVDLVAMLASLTATLADEWRSTVLRVTPEEFHAHVPTSDQLIRNMIMHLKTEESVDA